jgi:glutaredoxin
MQIKIYTKSICPYCVAAKNWLRSKGYTYEEVVLDNDAERLTFYEAVGNGIKTVPQIFVDNERIGGYTDLVKSHLASQDFGAEF